MADTSNRIAGTAYVTVNGVSVMVEGSFKYQPSTVNRTTLTGMDGVHGYKESLLRRTFPPACAIVAAQMCRALTNRPMSTSSRSWRMAKQSLVEGSGR